MREAMASGEEEAFQIVVVDEDEGTAEVIEEAVEHWGGARITGVFRDLSALEDILDDSEAHLLFVDPAAGSEDPRAVLELVTRSEWPRVILVTGAQELAAGAFEHQIVDFLIKPLTRARVIQALERAQDTLLVSLLKSVAPAGELWEPDPGTGLSFPGRLMIREQGRVFFVEMNDIRYVQSDGNYLRIHTGDSSHLARGTMREVVERLDPERFVRIHRSTIVAIDYVVRLQTDDPGEWYAVLKDRTRRRVSRSGKRLLEAKVTSLP